MKNIKDELFKEIEERIKKKNEARERALNKSTLEAFVLAFIKNIEEISMMTTNKIEWQMHAENAIHSLRGQIHSFDNYAKLEVSWLEEEDRPPTVNGVTIKWSRQYQKLHNCDSELFLDVTELLFS